VILSGFSPSNYTEKTKNHTCTKSPVTQSRMLSASQDESLGSISAITAEANDKKRLQLRPEETFHGHPPAPLTVFNSQAACQPKLAVGDR